MIIPAIAIPTAFVILAVSALGFPRFRIARALSFEEPTLRRVLHPAPLAIGSAVVMLFLLAAPAVASSAPVETQGGVGLAQLWITPYGNQGAYVGDNPDPWLSDSWVVNVSNNNPTLKINVTSNWGFQSFDVKLRINVNNLSDLSSITATCTLCDTVHQGASHTFHPSDFAVGTPTLANGASYPPHGIYPTNYTNFTIGGIGPQGANNTTVLTLNINGLFTAGMMVNFDADGWTYQNNQRAAIATFSGTNIRNPYSHDTTVRIPDVTSVVLPASVAGLAYAFLRRKKGRPA